MNKAKQIINKIGEFFRKIFHKDRPCILKGMTGNKAGIALVIIAVLLGVLYYFRGTFIAAVVNGKPISRLAVIQKLEKTGGQEALDAMVTETLIFQEAKKLKLEPTDAEVKAQVNEVKAQLEESGQDINALLAYQGMTMEDFENQIRLQRTIEKVLSEKITVTEEEINAFIEQNKDVIPEDMPEEEVKTVAESQVKSEKMGTEFQKWIEKLKALSSIEYLVKYE